MEKSKPQGLKKIPSDVETFPPQPPFYHEDMEMEDEIHLADILITLLKHKFLIIGMVLLAGIAAVIFTVGRQRTYRSEATIEPTTQNVKIQQAFSMGGSNLSAISDEQFTLGGSGSQSSIFSELNSRRLAARVIKTNKLMPTLFPEQWDHEKNRWKSDVPQPSLQDGIKAIRNLLQVETPRKSKNIISVAIIDKDPKMAKRLVDYYLAALSESMRAQVLRDTRENIRFLKEQLTKTRDPLVVEKIYALLASKVERETFAMAQKYFGFRILDPPIAPDTNKGTSTHRKRDCLLAVVVAFFLAVFLSFMIEFGRNFKTQDPERYQELVLRYFRLIGSICSALHCYKTFYGKGG